MTRWLTHFCAPAFFLLAGLGIGISRLRGATAASQTRYLLVRGLWLLVLELIITPIGWQFGFDLIPAFALVLWALGWSMIVMAVAVHLPVGVVAALAVVTIACHNLLDPLQPQSFGSFAGLWHALHVPGFVIPNVLFIGYPLVPWIGVMALGHALAEAPTSGHPIGGGGSWSWQAPPRLWRSSCCAPSMVMATLSVVRTADPGPDRGVIFNLRSYSAVLAVSVDDA